MPAAKVKEKVANKMTVAEYLERERKAFERSEYIDGEIYQMAGESGAHADISINLIALFHAQLKGKDCRVRAKETKVKSGGASAKSPNSTKGMFSYPDLLIVCGDVKYHDKHKDIVLNPKVVIEVLSRSTEIFDRNQKFSRYRMFNDTLTDYILVSQDEPKIEHYVRQKDNSWVLYTFFGLNEVCSLPSIGCKLPLSDVYDRVQFSKEALKFLKEIADKK